MGRLLEEQVVHQGLLPLLDVVGRLDGTGPGGVGGILWHPTGMYRVTMVIETKIPFGSSTMLPISHAISAQFSPNVQAELCRQKGRLRHDIRLILG